MIEFDCLCRQYRFSVPDELAGDTIQCPTCRRLNDVPTESELGRMDEFGGYKIELVDDPKALDHDLAIKAYTRGRIDEQGQQIDMRQTFDDVIRAGVDHRTSGYENSRRIAPKYDPETGEIIRPLAIKDEKPLNVIPLGAMAGEQPLEAIPIVPKTLDYNRSHVRSTTVAMAAAFVDLLKPANLVVMIFVLIGHLLLFTVGFVGPTGIVVLIALLIALFAHYGNVVDEIGPTDRDELPVLMRNASIGEDLWRPFVNVIISLFVVFLPALLVWFSHLPNSLKTPAVAICIVPGCLAAPLVLLTMITSGAYANFRLDRLISVVNICGIQYWIAAGTFTAALATYLIALLTIVAGLGALFGASSIAAAFSGIGSGVLLFALAIYLMHAATWQIGLLYRAHQPEFPWVLQRHIYTKAAEHNRPSGTISSTGILPVSAKHGQDAKAVRSTINIKLTQS